MGWPARPCWRLKFGAVRVTVGNAAPQWTKAEAGLEQAQGRGQCAEAVEEVSRKTRVLRI